MSTYRTVAEPSGRYSIALTDEEGRILLKSDGYPSRESAILAIHRCRANGQSRANYRCTSCDGKFSFCLIDGHGHRVADGPDHFTEQDRDACIAHCILCAASGVEVRDGV